MIIIIELTKLQVELKAKIKHSIAAINSIHFSSALFVITFSVLTFILVLRDNDIHYTLVADSNILASPEAGRGNCLIYV